MILLLIAFNVTEFVQCNINVDQAMLLQSENMYMKMKIEQLETELHCEKIRSRHFEGLSQIAMLELRSGHWVNSSEKRKQVFNVLDEVKNIRSEIVSKLDNCITTMNNILDWFILGKHWKFVAKRFLSPPREFKMLYGSELRQTTMENFVTVSKFVYPVVKVIKKEKKFVQTSIVKFMKSNKWLLL